MLPEIVLTSQLTERLRKVFGDRLGVYHSRYTDAERVEVYRKQISDTPYDIIVGVRSSVLLPFHNLGMVIIDEEHETSFKQTEPAPRYHARNVALVMARMSGAKTLLGTATPSLESYSNAVAGKYGYALLSLYKLVNKKVISSLGGSISSGKEANVFIAGRVEDEIETDPFRPSSHSDCG